MQQPTVSKVGTRTSLLSELNKPLPSLSSLKESFKPVTRKVQPQRQTSAVLQGKVARAPQRTELLGGAMDPGTAPWGEGLWGPMAPLATPNWAVASMIKVAWDLTEEGTGGRDWPSHLLLPACLRTVFFCLFLSFATPQIQGSCVNVALRTLCK